MEREQHIDPAGHEAGSDALYLGSPLIGPVVAYVRTLNFTSREQARRYYRLFGDLEYDVLTLNAELAAMDLRLRELLRRIGRGQDVSAEVERSICVTSHELTEHLYLKAEEHQARAEAARSFRFDPAEERRALLLFGDIAAAILGIADAGRRARVKDSLAAAIEGYGRLDLSLLLDIHDSVQPLIALQRREALSGDERGGWIRRTAELLRTHPLSRAGEMDDPHWISRRLARLRRSAERLQARLEHVAMVYVAVVRTARFRN